MLFLVVGWWGLELEFGSQDFDGCEVFCFGQKNGEKVTLFCGLTGSEMGDSWLE